MRGSPPATLYYVASGVDLGDSSGSPISHVAEVVDELENLGCDVVLLGLYSRQPDFLKCTWRGRPASRSNLCGRLVDWWNLSRILWSLPRRNRHAILYIRWGNTALAACLFGLVARLPYWLEMNGIYALVRPEAGRGWVRRLYAEVVELFERVFLRRAAGVFTTTPEMADYFVRTYGLSRSNHVVPNSCGVNLRTHSPSISPYRTGVPGARPVVGYAGGLWRQTGFDILVEAAPAAAKDFPNIRFKVAGGSTIADQFIRRVGELGYQQAFEFVGSLPYFQVPAFLQDVDVAVAPYRDSESLAAIGGGTPQKIFTYLACGKPTIITDLAYYERFRACAACFFFRDGDAADLARVISAVIRVRQADALMLAKAARDFAVEHFSWSRNARCIIATLERVHRTPLQPRPGKPPADTGLGVIALP